MPVPERGSAGTTRSGADRFNRPRTVSDGGGRGEPSRRLRRYLLRASACSGKEVLPVPIDREELLREVHGRHGGSLWALAFRLTGDRGRAEDVVQETFLRAWLSPAVLTAPDPARRAWLYTVARHLVADEWRSKRAHAEVATAEPPETSTADPSDDAVQAWLVAEALSRLTQEHRQVLVECFYRSRSVAEAARCLGVPEGTVKSRTHYALRALRLVLQEMGVTP